MSDGTLHVPARDVPVPTSVSPEAQAVVGLGPLAPPAEWPALEDTAGWKALNAEADQVRLNLVNGASLNGMTLEAAGSVVEDIELGSFPVYVVTPEGLDPGDRRIYLEIHGGAWIQGGRAVCRSMAQLTAHNMGSRVWSVDYRMPPDHPHPAPLDDCMAAYRRLLEERRPDEIVVGGMSAGANLAAALIVRAHDEGLPQPAAVVLETGAFDLTVAGDSWRTNMGLDSVLTGDFTPAMELYAAGTDPRDRYLSPLFADLSVFPPTILTSGTRDLLLSDTVRMHRALLAAGMRAELHIWEAAGHGMFLYQAPEDADKAAEIRRFAERHWKTA